MARYKRIDTSPKFLPVVLSEQLLPGTFEHALNHLLDHELDLTGLDERFCNDATGAPAYPPATLLKLSLRITRFLTPSRYLALMGIRAQVVAQSVVSPFLLQTERGQLFTILTLTTYPQTPASSRSLVSPQAANAAPP